MPSSQPNLEKAIEDVFPKDHLKLAPTQWLISASGTAVELAAKLGIYDAAKPEEPATGTAIILATSSYYGRAPGTVWDWMRAKLESPQSG